MKITHYIYMAMMAVVFSACSNIADDDRLIYVEPAAVKRAVLIEDFTGQKCVNCPQATEKINDIIKTYGEDNVIAVAIHCGPYGVKSTSSMIGLMTDTGSAYWTKWTEGSQIGQPSAKINRGAITDQLANWQTDVQKAMSQETSVKLNVTTDYNETTRQLTINTSAIAPQGTKGNYQLWLTEDSIIAVQMISSKEVNTKYVHNHVLRKAINGDWGEAVTFSDKELSLTNTTTLDNDYVAKNCYVVAFIYDDNNVMQVVKAKVGKE